MNNSIDQVRALLTEWNILLSQIEEAMASLSVVIPHQKREEAPVLAIARRLASTLETMAKQRDVLHVALEELYVCVTAMRPSEDRLLLAVAAARRVLEECK